MAKYLVEYTRTEIVRERVFIEADSAAEAQEAVETYDFDNSYSYETDSFRWEVSDVEVVEEVLEDEEEEES